MKADMHVHTRASDGQLTCADVVSAALSAGLNMVAVTDHDTFFNSASAIKACSEAGIFSPSGIEVSAYDGDVKVHTLGYGFDLSDESFAKFMARLREGSYSRTEDILSKLGKCGVNLSFEEVAAERLSPETPIHVMHVCYAGAKRGYAQSADAFFYRYVMYGMPAFSNICRPTPEEAVEAIVSAGGTAVIAHPGRVSLEKQALVALIERMKEAGLGGIEAVYSAHTVAETEYYRELAAKLGLFVTGGSDTHYFGGNRRVGYPEFHPSEELLRRLGI